MSISKTFTHVTYDCSKISWCLLKTLHGSVHAKDDSTAYIRAVSYVRKMFVKSTSSLNFLSQYILLTTSHFSLSRCILRQGILTEREDSVQMTSLHQPVEYKHVALVVFWSLSKIKLSTEVVICTEPYPLVSIPSLSILWSPLYQRLLTNRNKNVVS